MIRYVGPAAAGARTAAGTTPADILDLAERALYATYSISRQENKLLGPALVAYFSCCGGSVGEVAKMKRGDLVLKKKSGSLFLPGADLLLPREVPLFDFARSNLRAYADETDYASDDDPLFKTCTGATMTGSDACQLFSRLGKRINLDGEKLPSILRSAFARWLDGCTDHVRLYLIGKKAIGLSRAAPDPEPDASDIRAQFFAAHPMAQLRRDELNQPGPVRRAFPDPHFPSLSRDGRSDLGLKDWRKYRRVPDEARTAIRAAVASGMHKQATADHFGVNLSTVRRLSKGDALPTGPKPSHPSYKRTLKQLTEENSDLTPRKLTALVNEKYGIDHGVAFMRQTVASLGIKLTRQQKTSKWADLRPALLEMMTSGSAPSRPEIRAWLAERGVDVTVIALREALRMLGLSHLARREVTGENLPTVSFETAWPAVREALVRDPGLPNTTIGEIVERETGHAISKDLLKRLIEGRGDLPPRTGVEARSTAGRPARTAFEKAWPQLRARISEDPGVTNVALVEIVFASTGRKIKRGRLVSFLAERDDVPPRRDPGARKVAALAAIKAERRRRFTHSS
jgi:transposase